MSGGGSVYLIGSSEGDAVREVFRRVRMERAPALPTVAVSFAAQTAVRDMARALEFARSYFPGCAVERFSVPGETDAMTAADASSLVQHADVLFFGGGDPVLCAERLTRAGADAWVRTARARGATCVGLSAGSVALGALWATWPDDDPDAEPRLVRCMGVAKGLVVDCHAESDDWDELRIVHQTAMRENRTGLHFAGIGHGSALIVGGEGELEWLGKPMLL